ncbi:MAG: hypothetical protein JRF59_08385 [Deltaproteobacteria bacterium]|nr:hypothetical protein [Deltaproteobacteria bacterium]MBW1923068.1 hypothetical protein [Deltaproteobacteria bacterium]MBW1949101.1 hypothetical protein [Deltaproteobacteria bacterium]MBW2008594.1 hypothetical protein [Deltaproteobacteria bacterium]MBW2103810.1 hypothetical protein [Deltaproteobacteria bacterium]
MPLAVRVAFLTVFMGAWITGTAGAYLLPARQILGFCARNFEACVTALVEADTIEFIPQRGELAYGEKIFLAAPDSARRERVSRADGWDWDYAALSQRDRGLQERFWFLILCNPEDRLEKRLRDLGLALEDVNLTRVEGLIGYAIGGRGPREPVLVIEKDRFLPLLLRYRAGPLTPPVTIRFDDYRTVGKVWFPHKVVRTVEGGPRKTSFFRQVRINVPLDSPSSGRLTPSEAGTCGPSRTGQRDPGGRRLDTIHALTDRYR